MNILITGGCGFIGTSLVSHLLKDEGNRVCVVDNLSVGTRENLGEMCDYTEYKGGSPFADTDDTVTLVVGNILDRELATSVVRGADVVVHLAANTGVAPSVENPFMDCEINVLGTLNYLEACRVNGVKRFVFASSGAPVGECEPPIHERVVPRPVSPYGASKLAGEGYCSVYYRTFGIDTVALRFGNVYGPGSAHKSSVVAKFIRQALSGDTLEIYGDGKQTRDFIFISDLSRAIELASTVEGSGGEIFQIATSAETTIREMTEKLVAILSDSGVTDIKVRYESPRLGDVKRNFSDTSKANEILGWQSEISLDKGLRHTVEHFLSRSIKYQRRSD